LRHYGTRPEAISLPTEIGAWMDFNTMRKRGAGKGADSQRPGGFYTQDDMIYWKSGRKMT